MSTIDIRKEESNAITDIRICGAFLDKKTCQMISENDKVTINDGYLSSGLEILDKEHAQNLIKGIQKAIDLGWFDED